MSVFLGKMTKQITHVDTASRHQKTTLAVSESHLEAQEDHVRCERSEKLADVNRDFECEDWVYHLFRVKEALQIKK